MPPQADLQFEDEPIIDNSIVYTEDELLAMRRVRSSLIADHDIDRERIGLRALAIITLVSKNRVDEAAKKYAKLLEALEGVGINSLADDEIWNEEYIRERADQFQTCGTDEKGRDIMWMQAKEIPLDKTIVAARAGLMYYMAQHASPITLREGLCGLVIDVATKKSSTKFGNEKQLQNLNQAYPCRPQAIIIAGCTITLRVVINSLITVASVFTKQKILDRIKFASVKDAMQILPNGKGPKYCGGDGGGIDDVVEYIKERIESIPIPEIFGNCEEESSKEAGDTTPELLSEDSDEEVYEA